MMMTHDDEFSARLLKQNGIDPGAVPPAAQAQLDRRIDEAVRNARRTKALALTLWALTFASFFLLPRLLWTGMERDRTTEWVMGQSIGQFVGMITWALGVLAIVFSALWYVRWRGATLAEVNARLARLERALGERAAAAEKR